MSRVSESLSFKAFTKKIGQSVIILELPRYYLALDFCRKKWNTETRTTGEMVGIASSYIICGILMSVASILIESYIIYGTWLNNIFCLNILEEKYCSKLKIAVLPRNLTVSLQNYEKFILKFFSKKCTVISIDCKNFWEIIVITKLQIEQFFRDFILNDGPPFRFPK